MMETEISDDFGRQMYTSLKILEKSWGIKLTTNQMALLAEIGTVEQLLSIIVDCPIHVEIERTSETGGVYTRETYLCDNSRRLIRAVTHYSETCLTRGQLGDLKKMGIGSMLLSHHIDTRRRITKLGYNGSANRVYRIYEIIHDNNVLFTIEESFDLEMIQ